MALPPEIKDGLRRPGARVSLTIRAGSHEFAVEGRGHPGLILTHPEDIVVRKSDFICPRTLAVGCDKASDMLPREMVALLQDPATEALFTISVD